MDKLERKFRLLEPSQHSKLESCPLCNGDQSELWREKNGYRVVKCTKCSFVYVEDYPTEEFLADYYRSSYSSEGDFKPAGDSLRKFKYQFFSSWISQKFPDTEVIKTLEIGCGQGDFQSAVHKNPKFEAVGFDYSEPCVNYAQSQGLNVRLGDFKEAEIEDATYDLVVALHVLEHVHDLNATLAEFYRVLKPGGLAFAVCPSVTHFKQALAGESWKYLGPPGHLWYLSPKTFPQFFTKAGFSEILHCSHFYHRAHVRVLARK